MKSIAARVIAAVLGVVVVVLLAGAGAKKSAPMLQPDKLIILSTTDVKGKTSPCG
jgi:hypothetical protein